MPRISKKEKNIQSLLNDLSLGSFPKLVDNLQEIPFNQEDDEIIGSFTHFPKKEYEDVVLYQQMSKECVEFIKETVPFKLTDVQRQKIKIFICKLYIKMVIYIEFICLNSHNVIYDDLDENRKKIIDVISRLTTKIHDLTFLMRKKSKFLKSELIVLFNTSYLLYSKMVELIKYDFEEDIQKLTI